MNAPLDPSPSPIGTPPSVHVVTALDLIAAGRRVAATLDEAGVEAGVEAGGAVAALGANTPELLAAYRGAVWSGRYFTPLSPHWSADDIGYVTENCGASVLFADPRWPELAAAAAAAPRIRQRYTLAGELDGFRPWSDVESTPPAMAAPIAGATMLYTSGTTGRPKGVRRATPGGPPPSRAGASGAAMLQAFLPDGVDPSAGPHLVACPLHHAGPLSYADGASVLGADLIVMERFDAETFLALIEEHGVTSTFVPPIIFVRLLRLPADVRARYDVSSLQVVVHGAAPVAINVKREMIDWLGPVLYEFYGGTEGGGTGIDSETWLERPGSVGKPWGARNMAVLILDDDGAEVPAGIEGDVYFRENDPNAKPFSYEGDAAKTAEAWRDGCYTLGDIGYLDTDGYLYLCDRRSDVIISGGVNLFPAQIESGLLAHPGIADCCVVGVPDAEWGEAVHAVVQLVEGFPLSPAAVLEFCAAGLPSHQRPRSVSFAASLPRTDTGKLARRSIRSQYWGDDRRI